MRAYLTSQPHHARSGYAEGAGRAVLGLRLNQR
jgi:hypothetical protein